MVDDNLTKDNLAGVIVLYNPDSSTVTNIATFINFLSHLYVVDNSPMPDMALIASITSISANISYHPFGENLGIARALNQGCTLAARDDYKWILTMDQDSYFENSAFFDQVLNKNYPDTAIIAASYNNIHFKPRPSAYTGLLEVDYVITSGNILNIAAWQMLNGFIDELFIDEVDNEFCIRARNKGLKILVTSDVHLLHKLGEGITVKHFLTRNAFILSKHSPLRVYYVVRNNLYIWRKFKFSNFGFVANRVRNIIALVSKVVLYFPDKKVYFRYIGMAIKDFFKGKYGKFSNRSIVMNNNDISIVLAVYNGEKYISMLLDSVLAQADVTIRELIIIDDTSSDNSVEIIKTYQQKHPVINLIRNEVNLGPIASFIKGASLTSSNYIAFADQDDIWQADKLSLSLNLLKKIDLDNKPAVVFTDLAMIDEQDNPLHPSFWDLYHIKPANNNFFTILFANIATGCTMLINKNMLDEFITMPLNAQMHDHWIALIAFSFGNWGYLDEKTVLYRVHNNSVTSKDEVTFGKKAKNFLVATFSKNPVFLSEYIDQAGLFRSKYKNRLTGQQNRQLDYFIGLKNSSGLIKKINSKFRFALKKRMF